MIRRQRRPLPTSLSSHSEEYDDYDEGDVHLHIPLICFQRCRTSDQTFSAALLPNRHLHSDLCAGGLCEKHVKSVVFYKIYE